MTSLAGAFQELLAALDRLEILFLVGGSVASGTHGVARQTNDIDILADLPASLAPAFCRALGLAFFTDADIARRAVAAGRAFNVIHLQSAYKFDIFPVGENPFARSELARRRFTTTTFPGIEDIEFPVASPEDTILSKLLWYRKGGEMSDRQWQDILGVIQVQGAHLDRAYLLKWAAELGVAGLLDKALLPHR